MLAIKFQWPDLIYHQYITGRNAEQQVVPPIQGSGVKVPFAKTQAANFARKTRGEQTFFPTKQVKDENAGFMTVLKMTGKIGISVVSIPKNWSGFFCSATLLRTVWQNNQTCCKTWRNPGTWKN